MTSQIEKDEAWPARSVVDPGVGRLAATVDRLRKQVLEAQSSACGRALVELAAGVLAERLRCDLVQAAEQLHVLAEKGSRSTLEIATEIVGQAEREELALVTRDLLAAAEEKSDASGHPGFRAAESAALAAEDAQSVSESLLAYALAPLGAIAVAVWSASSDGSLSLSGSAGFTPAEARRWRYVPPAVATFARQALSRRQAVWQPSLTESAPSVGGAELPDGSRVALPAGTGGRLLGVLEICWPGPVGTLPAAVHRQLESLAELCAHTLDQVEVPDGHTESPLVEVADAILDAAMVLRPVVDDTGSVTDFRLHHLNERFSDLAGRTRAALVGCTFLEAFPLSARKGGPFELFTYVFATGEPLLAGRAQVMAMVERITFSGTTDYSIIRHGGELLVTWRLHDETARLADLLQHAQRLGRIGGFEENLATGEIIWNAQLFELYRRDPSEGAIALRNLAAHAHPDDGESIERFQRALVEHGHPASTDFRFRRPDGSHRHIRVVAEPVLDGQARLAAVRGAYQDVSAQHWTEIALEATREQLTKTQAHADAQNRLTLQLQHAIMPPAQGPISSPGLSVAVRYRPAGSEHLVGGDWYDVLPLPSGKTLLSVGDIAGHGIQAATDMVVLRNALRGLSATGAGPAQLLYWLNNVTHDLTDHLTATAVCGIYDPADGTFRWARAGHPVPLMLRAGEASPLPAIDGVLLGLMPDSAFEEGVVRLAPGDRLLFYTDGLIERRDIPFEQALDHLISITTGPALDLDSLLARSVSDTDDDTCVVEVLVRPETGP